MTTIGIDYASIDGNSPPKFDLAYQAGARFALVRAVYGRPAPKSQSKQPYIDPTWARDRTAIVAAGIKRGAYLFVCYPRKCVFTPSPEVQAQAYIDYVKLDRGKDFVPLFDVEQASDILTTAQMYDWTLRVCRLLKAHYDVWPGIYTSARVWAENLKNHAAGELINCPLWLAKPWPWAIRTTAHLDGAPGFSPSLVPQFGNQCFLYQYQGDAFKFPGFDQTVDISRFELTREGAKGEQVRWLQRRLGVAVDADFGPQTKAAVEAFQTVNGLTVDGIVGLNTFTPLSWVLPTT